MYRDSDYRCEHMIASGFLKEVGGLLEDGTWDLKSLYHYFNNGTMMTSENSTHPFKTSLHSQMDQLNPLVLLDQWDIIML